MTQIRTEALGALRLPDPWRAALLDAGHTPASALAVLDAYATSSTTEIILRLDGRAQKAVTRLRVTLDGRPVTPIEGTPVPRGLRLTFAQPATRFQLSWAGSTLSGPIAGDASEWLAEHNTLFAIATDPDPKVVADWLAFHAAEQGATAALILARGTAEPPPSVSRIERLLWLTCPLPLGHPGQPAQSARHLAPDGPGKARLDPPDPDPERAPLMETAVMEAIRRRFLQKARAVLFCHPSDLVPRQTRTVFDLAAAHGFVRFKGRRAYPMAMKSAPRHADHSAVSFDGSVAESIWCVAPTRLPPDAFWRQFRVGAPPDDASHGLTYWRCMGLRHPGLKLSELVPRSSLIPQPDLMALTKKHFGPSRIDAQPAPKQTRVADGNRVLIVTTMKNEGPFILDWIAFHRAIGVSDFLIYTNDCSDGTDGFLSCLAQKGLVDHRENPFRALQAKPQRGAFRDAESQSVLGEVDWIIPMDVDEYIDVHTGAGRLSDLFAAVPDATMISLTWRLFGNSDIHRFSDTPVHQSCLRAAPELCRKPHQAWGFKTLYRNLGHYRKLGVHRPKGLNPEFLDDIRWVNGSGVPMPTTLYRTGWRSTTQTYGYDLASLNHYSLRSAESFLVKRDRGRANHVDRDQGLAYWFRMNHNAVRVETILKQNALFEAERARLLEDPQIATWHSRCVAAHEQKIAALHEMPEFARLYEVITSDRLQSLSRRLHHFGTQVFLEGPSAVADDFHLTAAAFDAGNRGSL